jgi:hypothetical protein
MREEIYIYKLFDIALIDVRGLRLDHICPLALEHGVMLATLSV